MTALRKHLPLVLVLLLLLLLGLAALLLLGEAPGLGAPASQPESLPEAAPSSPEAAPSAQFVDPEPSSTPAPVESPSDSEPGPPGAGHPPPLEGGPDPAEGPRLPGRGPPPALENQTGKELLDDLRTGDVDALLIEFGGAFAGDTGRERLKAFQAQLRGLSPEELECLARELDEQKVPAPSRETTAPFLGDYSIVLRSANGAPIETRLEVEPTGAPNEFRVTQSLTFENGDQETIEGVGRWDNTKGGLAVDFGGSAGGIGHRVLGADVGAEQEEAEGFFRVLPSTGEISGGLFRGDRRAYGNGFRDDKVHPLGGDYDLRAGDGSLRVEVQIEEREGEYRVRRREGSGAWQTGRAQRPSQARRLLVSFDQQPKRVAYQIRENGQIRGKHTTVDGALKTESGWRRGVPQEQMPNRFLVIYRFLRETGEQDPPK